MSRKIFDNYDRTTEPLNKYSKNNKTENSFDLCKRKYLEQSSDIAPCPGGCLYESMQSEINFRDSNSFLTEDSTSSLNVHQSKLIKNNDVHIDDILQTKIKCPNLYKSLEEQDKYDKIRVCGIVISTVMKIAKHSYTNITTEHVKCTESYFKNLKEKNGHPHNISKILQIIKNLKNSGMIEHAEETEKNHFQASEENVYINDLINR